MGSSYSTSNPTPTPLCSTSASQDASSATSSCERRGVGQAPYAAALVLASATAGYAFKCIQDRTTAMGSFKAALLSYLPRTSQAKPSSVRVTQPALTDCTTTHPETHTKIRPLPGTKPDYVPPEISGDVFDRQRCVPGFDQVQMENQVVLCLGTGGIGCSVALACVRLGVKRLYLVDYDTVEGSNLNRQVLFRKEDVGRPKVYAAKEALERSHNLRTEILAYNIDAVRDFGRIVGLARNSTVIFNNIDFGEAFDYASSSLAMSLRIPYLAASTYGAGQIEVVLAKNEDANQDPCWSCRDTVANLFSISKTDWNQPRVQEIVAAFTKSNRTNPDEITETTETTESTPTTSAAGASFSNDSFGVSLARTIARILSITHNLPELKLPAEIRKVAYPLSLDPRICNRPASLEPLYRAVRDTNWFNDLFFEIPGSESELLTLERVNSVLQTYAKRVEGLFLPSKVQELTDIGFMPRLKPFPARLAGSWTCVCVTGSFLLVNQWVQYLNTNSHVRTVRESYNQALQELKENDTKENQAAVAEKVQELEIAQGQRRHFAEWSMFDISCMTEGAVSVVTAPGEQNEACAHCADLKQSLKHV